MRASRIPLVVPIMLMALGGEGRADEPVVLSLPSQGTSQEKVMALWSQTRPVLLADAVKPLSDAECVARGEPLLDTWEALDANLGDGESGGATHAVMKLLGDFYGRADSPPSRRVAIRSSLRGDFAQRLAMVDSRVRR